MAKPKKLRSAKARTIPLSGVDMRAQCDANPPTIAEGPLVSRVVNKNGYRYIHYAISGEISLCGVVVDWLEPIGGLKHVCNVCHVEASKRLAMIR